MNRNLLFLLILLFPFFVVAQPYFPEKGRVFDDGQVPRIDISISPDSLLAIYTNIYSDHEYPADFLFTDNTGSVSVSNVGFRLRGNTSRSAAKKSFKVSFNSFVPNQKFYGLEKMNLNGEHNDPSVARSKIFWETAVRSRMPYSRANHVEVYINGNYYGVYVNVEHNDENYLQSRFGNKSGNFYKCLYPANLNYLGSDPNDYKLSGSAVRVYELKTNTVADDYTDLKNFISLLHAPNSINYKTNLEKVFNVNAYLRAYAMDVLTGNWDNYAGNQNNFYLYHNPETDKIDYITYDVDNTFGIDWIGKNWGTRNCYNWATDTANRPLVTKLFAHQEYVNRFSFFINKLKQNAASTAQVTALSDSIKNLISPYVATDSYHSQDYGYTFTDFNDSYVQSIGGHVKYGIQDFIATRNSYLNAQLNLNNVAPLFSETRHAPYAPFLGDSIYIKSWVEDEQAIGNVKLIFKSNSNGVQDTMLMFDDGLHKDESANDGIFGAGISGAALGDTIYYYLTCSDAFSAVGREPRAGFLKFVIRAKPKIFINELMSDNLSTVADNFGEYDDWFELYNNGAAEDLSQLYMSDDVLRPGKWQLGTTQFLPNSFLLFWADENGSQGPNHANFKLNNSGEQLILSQYNGVTYQIVDSLSFGSLSPNQSIGCYPDGLRPIVWQQPPSPGTSNMFTSVREVFGTSAFNIYPNPNGGLMVLETKDATGAFKLEVRDAHGRILQMHSYDSSRAGRKIVLDVQELSSGLYFLRLENANNIKMLKFIRQ